MPIVPDFDINTVPSTEISREVSPQSSIDTSKLKSVGKAGMQLAVAAQENEKNLDAINRVTTISNDVDTLATAEAEKYFKEIRANPETFSKMSPENLRTEFRKRVTDNYVKLREEEKGNAMDATTFDALYERYVSPKLQRLENSLGPEYAKALTAGTFYSLKKEGKIMAAQYGVGQGDLNSTADYIDKVKLAKTALGQEKFDNLVSSGIAGAFTNILTHIRSDASEEQVSKAWELFSIVDNSGVLSDKEEAIWRTSIASAIESSRQAMISKIGESADKLKKMAKSGVHGDEATLERNKYNKLINKVSVNNSVEARNMIESSIKVQGAYNSTASFNHYKLVPEQKLGIYFKRPIHYRSEYGLAENLILNNENSPDKLNTVFEQSSVFYYDGSGATSGAGTMIPKYTGTKANPIPNGKMPEAMDAMKSWVHRSKDSKGRMMPSKIQKWAIGELNKQYELARDIKANKKALVPNMDKIGDFDINEDLRPQLERKLKKATSSDYRYMSNWPQSARDEFFEKNKDVVNSKVDVLFTGNQMKIGDVLGGIDGKGGVEGNIVRQGFERHMRSMKKELSNIYGDSFDKMPEGVKAAFMDLYYNGPRLLRSDSPIYNANGEVTSLSLSSQIKHDEVKELMEKKQYDTILMGMQNAFIAPGRTTKDGKPVKDIYDERRRVAIQVAKNDASSPEVLASSVASQLYKKFGEQAGMSKAEIEQNILTETSNQRHLLESNIRNGNGIGVFQSIHPTIVADLDSSDASRSMNAFKHLDRFYSRMNVLSQNRRFITDEELAFEGDAFESFRKGADPSGQRTVDHINEIVARKGGFGPDGYAGIALKEMITLSGKGEGKTVPPFAMVVPMVPRDLSVRIARGINNQNYVDTGRGKESLGALINDQVNKSSYIGFQSSVGKSKIMEASYMQSLRGLAISIAMDEKKSIDKSVDEAYQILKSRFNITRLDTVRKTQIIIPEDIQQEFGESVKKAMKNIDKIAAKYYVNFSTLSHLSKTPMMQQKIKRVQSAFGKKNKDKVHLEFYRAFRDDMAFEQDVNNPRNIRMMVKNPDTGSFEPLITAEGKPLSIPIEEIVARFTIGSANEVQKYEKGLKPKAEQSAEQWKRLHTEGI